MDDYVAGSLLRELFSRHLQTAILVLKEGNRPAMALAELGLAESYARDPALKERLRGIIARAKAVLK